MWFQFFFFFFFAFAYFPTWECFPWKLWVIFPVESLLTQSCTTCQIKPKRWWNLYSPQQKCFSAAVVSLACTSLQCTGHKLFILSGGIGIEPKTLTLGTVEKGWRQKLKSPSPSLIGVFSAEHHPFTAETWVCIHATHTPKQKQVLSKTKFELDLIVL